MTAEFALKERDAFTLITVFACFFTFLEASDFSWGSLEVYFTIVLVALAIGVNLLPYKSGGCFDWFFCRGRNAFEAGASGRF